MKNSNLKIGEEIFVADTKPITQTLRVDAVVFGKLANFIGLEHQENGKWQRGSSEAVSKVINAIVTDLETKGTVNLSTITDTITEQAPAPAKTTPQADTSKAPSSKDLKNKA